MEAEKAIDPQLKELLCKAGAEDYVPVFAKKGVGMKQVVYMNDKQLSEVTFVFHQQNETLLYTDFFDSLAFIMPTFAKK